MPSPRRYSFIPLIVALFVSCEESNFEPVVPRVLDPPSEYRSWWGEVELCVGGSADFDRVHWYEAEQLINLEEGTNHSGAWLPPHNIYIRSDKLLFEAAVKHEIVHEILQRRDHDTHLFQECAGL